MTGLTKALIIVRARAAITSAVTSPLKKKPVIRLAAMISAIAFERVWMTKRPINFIDLIIAHFYRSKADIFSRKSPFRLFMRRVFWLTIFNAFSAAFRLSRFWSKTAFDKLVKKSFKVPV